MGSTPAAPPAPAGVRVGCDLHPVAEVERAIAVFGERYLARVFTADERADAAGADHARRLAARFAGKEAVLKVLEPGPADAVPWTDIEVRSTSTGAPAVVLHGAAARLATTRGVAPDAIAISLSHEDGLALAFAAATPIPLPGRTPA